MWQIDGRHVAICELSLAQTYAKHGRWQLVAQCCTMALNALNRHPDNGPIRDEAWQLLGQVSKHLNQE